MTKKLDIKTFVFLDIETTGLPQEEHNATKITELSMIAIQSSHLLLGVIPRVQNKLTLCFNPWKAITYESEKITDLSNDLLEHMPSFTGATVFTINGFLDLPKPICFVAHNGNYFDYPILRRTIEKTNIPLLDVYCIDTLEMFREFQEPESVAREFSIDEVDLPCTSLPNTPQSNKLYKVLNKLELDRMTEIQQRNETTPKKQMIRKELDLEDAGPVKKFKKDVRKKLNFQKGFKLEDLYRKFTHKNPVDTHRAEGDNILLMTCVAYLGDQFIDWANKNAKKFCDIPAMAPFKKIGT